jgi:hypothetical protein
MFNRLLRKKADAGHHEDEQKKILPTNAEYFIIVTTFLAS